MKFSKIVLCLVVISVLLISCKSKEKRLIEKLEGDWDVELYSEDGFDLIGSDIVAVEIELKDYDNKDGKGRFIWVTQDSMPMARRVVRGDYTLDDDVTRMNFNTDEVDFFIDFDIIELSGDNLELNTTLDSIEYFIQAKRR